MLTRQLLQSFIKINLIVGFEDMCLLLVRDTEKFLAGHMNVSARKGVFSLVVP